MARRKHKTIVQRNVTLRYTYDPLTEGVPSETESRDLLQLALGEYEDERTGLPVGGEIVDVKTTTRRVPIQEPQG